MPPLSPLWQYFDKYEGIGPKAHYKNDWTHKKAYCRACIDAEVASIRASYASVTVAGGTPCQPPSIEELHRQGACLFFMVFLLLTHFASQHGQALF